jgi:hypothetical protein
VTEPPYVEGERVFAPPNGSFDADWVAAAARQQDPGLPPETAALLANQAWALLRELGSLDAPALARALMAANAGVGATPCNVVATASVAFCESYGVSSGA